jgi:hypothetical protein
MISTINEVTIVNTGWKDTYAAVQHNKFMKGIERADQCLSFIQFCGTVKWSKQWYCIC